MTPEQHSEFFIGREFLEHHERSVDKGSEIADLFTRDSGEKLPASVEGLGTVLSLLYRAACCAWDCRGGDHQAEWLAGRVVNQAMSSYRLIRGAYYDESLMLVRGIGEIANLLSLFHANDRDFHDWKTADRGTRLNRFGPAAVRKKLNQLDGIGAPIDDERYKCLCEVGTHPVPGFKPGHYSGGGRPVLGVLLQPVGVYVAVTELSFAVAMSALPLSKLLGLKEEQRLDLGRSSLNLVRSLGAFTVLNYNDLLAQALQKSDPDNVH